MLDINKCHPIELDDLIRVGSDNDGGYIVSKRQIDNTKLLLSFGINDDWTFEDDFSKRKPVKIYAYDYSIKNRPFVSRKPAEIYLKMLLNFFLIRYSRAKYHLNQLRLSKYFHQFFDSKQGRYFIPKFIEQYDDDQNTCFETIFKELGSVEDHSIFLKMDVESSEYLCLPQLLPYIRKLNGMVVEFHQLDIVEKKFGEILDMLCEHFYIAHVHGNNHGKLIYKTDIPSTLEITFIGKNLVYGEITLSGKKYPLKGLDAPCNRLADDYKLSFTN